MLNFTRLSTPASKILFALRKGDVVETLTGKFAFDRIPKGGRSWYGKSMLDGKNYRIRVFDGFKPLTVIGTYSFEPVMPKLKAPLKPMTNDMNDLNVGDLFVIKHGRGENAELFRYVRSTDRKVIAVNPVTNKTFNIDKNFTFTKITNLPY